MLNSDLNIFLLNVVPFALLALVGAWLISKIRKELK